MVCLDLNHPEIMDFINWKMEEEKKVGALMQLVIQAIMKAKHTKQ